MVHIFRLCYLLVMPLTLVILKYHLMLKDIVGDIFSCNLKLLVSQSKFSETRKFTLRYISSLDELRLRDIKS